MTMTIQDEIKCVRRELALRQRNYPKWVEAGRMKQADADKEIAAMQAVHDRLMRDPETIKYVTLDLFKSDQEKP